MWRKPLLITFILFIGSCQCIIILDRGNPARSIRGTFMDLNQADVTSVISPISDSENEFSTSQQHIQVLSGNVIQAIIDNLEAYNEAMTVAIISEARQISPAAAVNLCKFSRTRMSALRIINTFQSLRVESATAVINGDFTQSSILTEKLRTEVANVASDFVLMEQDLHQFDETRLGKAPMLHFSRAMMEYTALQTALLALREVIGKQ